MARAKKTNSNTSFTKVSPSKINKKVVQTNDNSEVIGAEEDVSTEPQLQQEDDEDSEESQVNSEPIQEEQTKPNKIVNFDYLDEAEVIQDEEENESSNSSEDESEDEAPEAMPLQAGKEVALTQVEQQRVATQAQKNKRKEANRERDLKLKSQKKQKKTETVEDKEDQDNDLELPMPLPMELLQTAASSNHIKTFEDETEEPEMPDIDELLKTAKSAKKAKTEKVVEGIKVKVVRKIKPWDLPEISVDQAAVGFLRESLYSDAPGKKRLQIGMALPATHIGPAPRFVRKQI